MDFVRFLTHDYLHNFIYMVFKVKYLVFRYKNIYLFSREIK